MDCLISYNWPGNVRELENAIEFAFIRSNKQDSISICKLPPALRQNYDCKKNKLEINSPELNFNKANELLTLLKNNKWNKSKVALELGINRTTLWRRIKSCGLE